MFRYSPRQRIERGCSFHYVKMTRLYLWRIRELSVGIGSIRTALAGRSTADTRPNNRGLFANRMTLRRPVPRHCESARHSEWQRTDGGLPRRYRKPEGERTDRPVVTLDIEKVAWFGNHIERERVVYEPCTDIRAPAPLAGIESAPHAIHIELERRYAYRDFYMNFSDDRTV